MAEKRITRSVTKKKEDEAQEEEQEAAQAIMHIRLSGDKGEGWDQSPGLDMGVQEKQPAEKVEGQEGEREEEQKKEQDKIGEIPGVMEIQKGKVQDEVEMSQTREKQQDQTMGVGDEIQTVQGSSEKQGKMEKEPVNQKVPLHKELIPPWVSR